MSDEVEHAIRSAKSTSASQKQALGIHRDLLLETYRFLSRADVETGLLVSARYKEFLERNSCSFPLRHFERFGMHGHLVDPFITLQHTDGRLDRWEMADNPDLPSIFRKVRNAFVDMIEAVAPGTEGFLDEWQQFMTQPEFGPTYCIIIACSTNLDSYVPFFLNQLRARDALFVYSFYSHQALPGFLRGRHARSVNMLVIRANNMRVSLDPRQTEASSLLDFAFTTNCARLELRCANNGEGAMEWIDAYVERFRTTTMDVLLTLPCILVENDERLYRDDLRTTYDGYSREMPSSFALPAATNVTNPLGM